MFSDNSFWNSMASFTRHGAVKMGGIDVYGTIYTGHLPSSLGWFGNQSGQTLSYLLLSSMFLDYPL